MKRSESRQYEGAWTPGRCAYCEKGNRIVKAELNCWNICADCMDNEADRKLDLQERARDRRAEREARQTFEGVKNDIIKNVIGTGN